MALSRTAYGPYLHDNSGGAQGTGPFTTGSFTPPDSSLLVVFVVCGTDSPGTADANYVVTGGSLTWTKREGQTMTFSPDGALIQIWTAPVTTGASMQVTVTHTGINSYSFAVFPYAYTGHDTSAPVAGDVSGSNTSTTNTLTLGATPTANDEAIGAILVVAANGNASDATIAPSGGPTEITEQTSPSSFGRWQTQARTSSTLTSFAWSTTTGASSPFDQRLFAAIIIKAASGVTSAALTAAGTGTFSPVGRSTAAATLTAAGTGTFNAVGRATAAAALTAAGAGAFNAVGASRVSAVALAAGTGTLNAVGASQAAAVLSAAGLGQLNAVGAEITGASEAVLIAAGAGTLNAVGQSIAAAALLISGSGTLIAIAADAGLEVSDAEPPAGGAGAGGWHPDAMPGKKKKREPRVYYLMADSDSNQAISDRSDEMIRMGPLTKSEAKKLEEQIQADADLNTLIEAGKIRQDPDRMRRVGDRIKAAREVHEKIKP